MNDRSELLEKIEEIVVYFMRQKADSFSERSELYSNCQKKIDAQANLREVGKLFNIARSKDVLESLTRIKQENVKRLSEIEESGKTLQERLELPVVVNYSGDQMSVLLPLNAEEKDKLGLQSRLYKTLSVVVGESEESLSYCGLSVITSPKRKSKKVKKEIEAMASEKDFQEANVVFKIEELNLLIDISKIGSTQTEMKDIKSAKTRVGKEYTVKDLAEKLKLSYHGAYDFVRKYSKEKGIKHKKSKAGKRDSLEFTQEIFDAMVTDYELRKGKKSESEERTYNVRDLATKLNITPGGVRELLRRKSAQLGVESPGRGGSYVFSEGQFKNIVSNYKPRKISRKVEKPDEKLYGTQNVAERLGITLSSAGSKVRRYCKRHNIKHKKRKQFRLTEKQFLDIVKKGEAIPTSQYRKELIEMVEAGRKDEYIVASIVRKHHIQNKRSIQGTINLYRHGSSKKQK
jgi:Mn-dependent DtxR family transcriptional regulator